MPKIVMMRYADKIPYGVIFDHLIGVDILIKPMFGCWGIYADGKLCLFVMNRDKPLIRRESEPMRKGVYVATTTEHCRRLITVFPKGEFEQLKGDKVWIFLSERITDFEEYLIRACKMIAAGDARIGR